MVHHKAPKAHGVMCRRKRLRLIPAVVLGITLLSVGFINKFDVAGFANPTPPQLVATEITSGNTANATDAANATSMVIHLVDANKRRSFQLTVPQGAPSTIKDVLNAANISLNHYDRMTPKPDQAVRSGMTITITRVSVGYRKRYVTHKPETLYKLTTSIAPGSHKVQQYQRTGKEEITERVWMKNGAITLIETVGRKPISNTQNKVVLLGTSPNLMPGKIAYHSRFARSLSLSARGGSPRSRMQAAAQSDTLSPVRSLTVSATAYSSATGRTATGMRVVHGIVAVDPRVIPLGTKMYVEGYGFAFASDTGGAIKGNRIDLGMASRAQAIRWGRRSVKVWILAPTT